MNFLENLDEFACWQIARSLSKNVFDITKIGALGEDELMQKHLKNKCIDLVQKIAECPSLVGKKSIRRQLNCINQICIDLNSLILTIYHIGYLPKRMCDDVQQDVNELTTTIQQYQHELNKFIDLGIISIQL